MNNTQNHIIKTCDECHSEYYVHTSMMDNLCPNCSHLLYDYQNCKHEFYKNKCLHCGWNGNVSLYLDIQQQ